jgi:very-short-patch-repair endonuclease
MTESVEFKRVPDNVPAILEEIRESDRKYYSLAEDAAEARIREIAERSGYSVKRDVILKGSWLREDLVIKGILFYQLDFFLQRGEEKIDIELDDLTHNPHKDYQRDVEMISWGYKVIRLSSSFYFNHKKRVYRLLRKIIGNDHSPNDELIFIGPNHQGLDFQFDCNLLRIYDPMLIAKLRKFKEKLEPRKVRTVEDLF